MRPPHHSPPQSRSRGIIRLSAMKRLARTPVPIPDNAGASTSTWPIVNHSMHSQGLQTIEEIPPSVGLPQNSRSRPHYRDEIPPNVESPQRSSPRPPSTGLATATSTRPVVGNSTGTVAGTSIGVVADTSIHRDVNRPLHFQQLPATPGRRGFRCVARNFREGVDSLKYCLRSPTICNKCGAKRFYHESPNICCMGGRISLPLRTPPSEMLQLYYDPGPDGTHFRRQIRAYNHVFAFTSMGVHVDETLAAGSRGIYTFRAQGSIYHQIGSLLPTANERPRYLQTYIYDTDHELEHRMAENQTLKVSILQRITAILNDVNPFVQQFRQLSAMPDIHQCRLLIKEQPCHMHQYAVPTAPQVAAIIVGGEHAGEIRNRDFMVETRSGQLMSVPDTAGYYDPLQYPILFPQGTYGWDININETLRVTARDYYAFILQIRQPVTESLLHHGGRLFQQYVVDQYVKIEAHKLRWIRDHQHTIRADAYKGLEDSFNAGNHDAASVGRRTILPSSFVGCQRDMFNRYQDAMALVRTFGKPDLFIIITCNPSWDEIKRELLPFQVPHDRPDLLARIFHARFEEFTKDIITREIFGRVIAYTYVVEFQKRGLPHAHMLIILDEADKPSSPEDYDAFVRAEIPDLHEEPNLRAAVLKHMIHGPCDGIHSRTSSCRKNGDCKKGFPKPFTEFTAQGNDSYPLYRRRNQGSIPLEARPDVDIDNTWVVPYNSWLLLKYDCHINVEVCASVKSVKYLYKYIHKGVDRVALQVSIPSHNDEVQQFIDARWVCAPDAVWRILMLPMTRIYPSVTRLQIHLPNMQLVRFRDDQPIADVIHDDQNSKTMLTEFFTRNADDPEARNYTYREFPQYYAWKIGEKRWARRANNLRAIGRIYTVTPADKEKFYLRLLLNHVRGPISFEDLRTHDGIIHDSFKKAAESRGLLEQDNSVRLCLEEACSFRMPSVLRRLFTTILVYNEPTGVRDLWDEFNNHMLEDYTSGSASAAHLQSRLLHELNILLQQHGKSVRDYDLPPIVHDLNVIQSEHRVIHDELSVQVPQCDLDSVRNLNSDQKSAFDTIMSTIDRGESGVYFVDGPGGTGKTYLYRAILAVLRDRGQIALATAYSGIAATILPGGRTAHSRFKLPINPDSSSTCSITKQSTHAELLRRATAIIWDEAPMAHRFLFESLDRTLRDICETDVPFGGKVMILGGDFRQVLPVVPRATQAQLINACFIKSSLWQHVQVLKLKLNMRTRFDSDFSDFLLRVGDGRETFAFDDFIKLPPEMTIPWEGEQSVDSLIDVIYPDVRQVVRDTSVYEDRALLVPTNNEVDRLNDKIIHLFPGDEHTFFSYDTVDSESRDLYQGEYVNSIAPKGMPPHCLTLKKGAPIMLLRNLEPNAGLCNGTWLICMDFMRNLIYAEVLGGQYKGTKAFIPRISMKPPDDVHLPFQMTRKQFLVRLSFAMTINKAQGQTLPNVGIYLSEHVFSHGQLYVALSRGIARSTTKVLVRSGNFEGFTGVHTRNVVYQNILLS